MPAEAVEAMKALTLILSLWLWMAGSVIAFLESRWYQKKAQTGFFGALASFFFLGFLSAFSSAAFAGASLFPLAILVETKMRWIVGGNESKCNE